MAGLDKIIKEIADEASAEAKSTLDNARSEADGVLADARSEADAIREKSEKAAKQHRNEMEQSRNSALALQKRQRLLETKQALLSETLDRAREELYALPPELYFTLLMKLAAQVAEEGEGEMMLCEKDTARLPGDFEAKLAANLPNGSTIRLSKETRPVDGGFVLKYGDVEANCSFAAIFDARREEFADIVSPILFGNA